jgi:hypothetical protein
MSLPVVFLGEADTELDAGFAWYEEQARLGHATPLWKR